VRRKTRAETPKIAAGHIGWLEAAAVLFISSVSKIFLIYPVKISTDGQTAAWTVPMFSGLISVVWVWCLVSVLREHPGEDIVSISRTLLGKYAAAVLGMAFYLLNLGLLIVGCRECSDSLAITMLPLTPTKYVIVLGVAVSLFVALRGLEVLSRLCVVGAALVILLLLATSLLAVDMWSVDSILPLFGPGAAKLLKVFGVRQSMYGEVLALGILSPYLRKSSHAGKAARWAVGAAMVAFTLTLLVCEMVFPYPSLNRQAVPLIRVTRLIYLGRFFQRFEAILAPTWLISGSLQTAAAILVASLMLCSALSIRSLTPVLVVTAALTATAALFVSGITVAQQIDFDILRPYSVILIDGWPIGLWIADRVRKRARNAKGGNVRK
jgi:spore germination protein (amino acid permease)